MTYDPCRPISVVVNPRTAPPAGQRLVTEALAEVGAQAGLEFRYEGPVNEVPVHPRRPFQPEIYGDRWAPVLIAWSDPAESPRLADRVAGLGGSTAYPVSDRESVYVTGAVTLDGPQFAEILNRDNGFGSARAVLLHELGHLIGLSHVDDVRQLMHDENSAGQTGFAAGDLSGMAALRSKARCHAVL
ncbi:MAG TPA: matrixin family metalloprotease [Acidimicrobiales bacterium]|nr:matrixin family metalloprotease [Acidimicrobiales bacterium]